MLSVRCNPEDEYLIKTFAASKGMNVSEFLREAAIEKIQEEFDLEIIKEYLAVKDELPLYTAEEVDRELDL
ncbi:CopG family transcriptional regulator [Alkalibacter rhizosphaerae]|uniref:CopG family transcriptional regulator n=1 Tax=Alkalibacter rhizosphaerae TaxID=2815577 RepID=A0A974XIE1_9FIRM|nr:DUF6290 family protein [Alkalibacter rhizosphaerae]QSX09260.1 CopG family transcriptional regulator [Alkalibacter rhizosphaerae]